MVVRGQAIAIVGARGASTASWAVARVTDTGGRAGAATLMSRMERSTRMPRRTIRPGVEVADALGEGVGVAVAAAGGVPVGVPVEVGAGVPVAVAVGGDVGEGVELAVAV